MHTRQWHHDAGCRSAPWGGRAGAALSGSIWTHSHVYCMIRRVCYLAPADFDCLIAIEVSCTYLFLYNLFARRGRSFGSCHAVAVILLIQTISGMLLTLVYFFMSLDLSVSTWDIDWSSYLLLDHIWEIVLYPALNTALILLWRSFVLIFTDIYQSNCAIYSIVAGQPLLIHSSLVGCSSLSHFQFYASLSGLRAPFFHPWVALIARGPQRGTDVNSIFSLMCPVLADLLV